MTTDMIELFKFRKLNLKGYWLLGYMVKAYEDSDYLLLDSSALDFVTTH